MTKASISRNKRRNEDLVLRHNPGKGGLEIVDREGKPLEPGDLRTGQIIRVDLTPIKPRGVQRRESEWCLDCGSTVSRYDEGEVDRWVCDNPVCEHAKGESGRHEVDWSHQDREFVVASIAQGRAVRRHDARQLSEARLESDARGFSDK